VTDTFTWTRDGLAYTATPPDGETKAKSTGKWTPADARKHPRDSEGKFIETGAEVRILGVGLGRVLADDAGLGKTAVRLTNGQTRNVPNGSLTVVARPDGSKPTGKPEDLKKPAPPQSAAPKTPPPAAKPPKTGTTQKLDTPEAIRAHWATGAESQPGLPDSHRELLRTAGTNAAGVDLSDGGNLVLLQFEEGGPWRVTNHHGQHIGPDQPDLNTARSIANKLEAELVDADGTPLDFNAPDFAQRAATFRTADGQTLGVVTQRIFQENDQGGTGKRGKPSQVSPEVIARLREVQEWKPLIKKPDMQWSLREGRPRIREAAEGLADAIEQGADAHTVIAAFDRYSAAVTDASNIPSKLGHSGDRRGRELAQDLGIRGRDAYLHWRANAPDADNPKGRRFRSVSDVREHLAAGGDMPTPLSHIRKDRSIKETAEKIADDSVLVGGGTFIAIRDPKSGKWNLHNSADGSPLIPPTDFDTWAEAGEVADALKTIEYDWDHPQHWLTGRYPVAEVQDVLAERSERRRDDEEGEGGPAPAPEPGGDETPEPEPKPATGPPPLNTPEAIRAYWESGGEGDARLSDYQRSTMRHAARNVEIQLSDDGGLVLARQAKGGNWKVLNLFGQPAIGENFANQARARDMARRLERDVVDANGAPFGWNNLDQDAKLSFRTDRGEAFEQALARVLAEHRAASDAEGARRGARQGRTRVGDAAAVRRYWAQGGDENTADHEPDEARRESHRRHMQYMAKEYEDIKVSPGGQFILTRSMRGLPWQITTLDGLAAARSGFSSEKAAREYAQRMETEFVDADGNTFDWQAPKYAERLDKFRNAAGETAAQVMARIRKGEPAPEPAPKPEPKPKSDGDIVADGGFADVEQLRSYLRAPSDAVGVGKRLRSESDEQYQKRQDERLAYVQGLADNSTLELIPSGRLAIVKGTGRGEGWSVLTPRLVIPASGHVPIKSRKEAREVAAKLDAMVDADGRPVPWASPSLMDDTKDWRDTGGRTFKEALIAVLGQHELDMGRPDGFMAKTYRQNEESRRENEEWQERARAGGYRLGTSGDLVAGDEVEFDVTATAARPYGGITYGPDTSANLHMFGGDDPLNAGEKVTVRGVFAAKYRPKGDSYTVYFDFQPGTATWMTSDGRSGPVSDQRFSTPDGTRVLFRRSEESEAFEQYLAGATPTPETVTRIGESYDVDSDALDAALRVVRDPSEFDVKLMTSGTKGRIRGLVKVSDAELDRLAMRARAQLEVQRQATPNRDKASIPTVEELAAVAAERRRRGLNAPSPEYVAGGELARRIHNGETVNLAELDPEQIRGARDYAEGAAEAWRDYFQDVVPDKDKHAGTWWRALRPLEAELTRRQQVADAEGGKLPDPGVNETATLTALGRIDSPARDAVAGLYDALRGDTPDPAAVNAAWVRSDTTLQSALDRASSGDLDISDEQYDWLQSLSDHLAAAMRRKRFRPTTAENRERMARYAAMDDAELLRRLDSMQYADEAYDDLVEVLEPRGYNEVGARPYGSPIGLTNPQHPSKELIGQRVAIHNGRGGWLTGFLHQRRNGDWVVSQSQEDPGKSPVVLEETGKRQPPFLDLVHPGHPGLADLDKGEYSTEELDAELNRLAPQIQALWSANRRRGDAEFDRLFDRYGVLLRERQERPDPEPEPLRQDEALFDETGAPTGDATPPEPRGTVVKASALAVGDQVEGGRVEQVTRIRDMVFATVRDGDDRRTVRGYPPDADVRRLAASGERTPDPVTVADVPSADLQVDDRLLLTRHDGHYLPATVTGVAVEGDTRRLDVRYDDGTTQTVLVDRGEVLPRLGGPEAGEMQPDPAGGEVADEPPGEAVPVAASTLGVGDRFMFDNRLDVYVVEAVDASKPWHDVTVRRERDGAVLGFGLGRQQTVWRMPGGEPRGEETPEPEQRPVVEPLPEGTTTARPVLYTYQRRNLVWLGLETSDDANVRQAALRVRDRMPLSAEQAAALAGAVRGLAADAKPGRQRSMERLAYTLDAAAAQARGMRKPRKPEGRGTPFKARAVNLVEGDVVALPTAKGRARVGKVTGKRTLMGGRLVELDIEYGDGTTERRLLNRDTDSYVLPDLPDDVPLPPEPAPSPGKAGPLSVAGHDYARRLGKLDDEIREYMSITASTEVTAKTFKSRDVAARALTEAFDRTVGGVFAERSHENLRFPVGLHGRALQPEATGVDRTLLRSRYMALLAERLPELGTVSRKQLIDAVQQLHVGHDAAADMPYYESVARTTLDKHPKGTLEHIIPGRLQAGDIIAYAGTEYEVGEITHRQSDMSVQVTLAPAGQDPSQGYRRTSTEDFTSHDGGPAVVRLERGPASADQPWDAVMEPDGPPVRITGDQINLGDRLMVENRYGRATTGVVVRIETVTGDTANREVTIRTDNSRNTVITIARGDHPGLFRLVEADEDVAERLRREQIERQRRQLTAAISQAMAATVSAVYTEAAGRGLLGAGVSDWFTLNEIDRVDLQQIYRRSDPAGTILRVLGVTDQATRDEMRRRLDPVIQAQAIAARDRVRESVQLAKPLPGEDATAARERVLQQIRKTPPAASEDFAAPAAALAALKEALDGTDTDSERILGDLPELGPVRDLRKRIGAYRAALGNGANFGKARFRRTVMADTTLADLEAGKVPAVETVDVAMPDRAADGGPGESAMRHLEIVRAAGKDLDAEMARRMEAAGVPELEGQLQEARTRADLRLADIVEMEDAMAQEAGFQSLTALRGAAARASDSDERQRLSALRQSIISKVAAERRTRRQRVDDLTRRIAAERRRAALAVLGEVREDGMGGVRIDWHDKSRAKGNKQLTERSELVKALRFAEDSYPRAWLERFRDHAKKNGQIWKVGKIKRGHYQDRDKLINLSDESVRLEGAPEMGRVATHEMGHGMEQAIPGMLAAQNAFLWSRTSTGEVGSRQRANKTEIYKGEYGYKDEFPEHYTGKDYVNPRTGEAWAFEVFTTGIESLMAGSGYLDDDFRQWMLGVMALLGTPGKDS
jgi:hypothetical protein